MDEKHKNDISIGKDMWIEWQEIDSRNSFPYEIDEILRPIQPFLKSLETECVSECCGIDAFDLWKDSINKQSENFNKEELNNALKRIYKEINKINSDVLISTMLNNLFHKSVFLKIVKHIELSLT